MLIQVAVMMNRQTYAIANTKLTSFGVIHPKLLSIEKKDNIIPNCLLLI